MCFKDSFTQNCEPASSSHANTGSRKTTRRISIYNSSRVAKTQSCSRGSTRKRIGSHVPFIECSTSSHRAVECASVSSIDGTHNNAHMCSDVQQTQAMRTEGRPPDRSTGSGHCACEHCHVLRLLALLRRAKKDGSKPTLLIRSRFCLCTISFAN